MTPKEQHAITLLRKCRFQPNSFAKGFVHSQVKTMETTPEKPLTERQREVLFELVHNYRRQHGACFCEECKAERILQEVLPL